MQAVNSASITWRCVLWTTLVPHVDACCERCKLCRNHKHMTVLSILLKSRKQNLWTEEMRWRHACTEHYTVSEKQSCCKARQNHSSETAYNPAKTDPQTDNMDLKQCIYWEKKTTDVICIKMYIESCFFFLSQAKLSSTHTTELEFPSQLFSMKT